MSSLGEAIIHLAIDLFHQIRQSEKENIFLSPFSVSSALAMTYLGARENTASEMQKVLHFSEIAENPRGQAAGNPVEKPGNIHHHFQKLLTELKKSTDAYELSVANRLYGEKEFPFLQEYMDNVQKYYLASVESADFKNAAEESRKMINSWVESQTNGGWTKSPCSKQRANLQQLNVENEDEDSSGNGVCRVLQITACMLIVQKNILATSSEY